MRISSYKPSTSCFLFLSLLLCMSLECCVSSNVVGIINTKIDNTKSIPTNNELPSIVVENEESHKISASRSERDSLPEEDSLEIHQSFHKNNISVKNDDDMSIRRSNLRGTVARELHAQDGFQRLIRTPIGQWTSEEWVFFIVIMCIVFCCILPMCRRLSCTDLIALWCCYEICCTPGGEELMCC